MSVSADSFEPFILGDAPSKNDFVIKVALAELDF